MQICLYKNILYLDFWHMALCAAGREERCQNDVVYQGGSSRHIFYGINLATLAEVEEQIPAFSNIASTL